MKDTKIINNSAISSSKHYDVIILGAGGAGLMCAIEAGKRGRRVLILDHAEKVGKKILISGGGRCNFTNLEASPEQYQSQNRHFCKSAFAQFSQYDFLEMVKRHNIKFHEKKLGQQFCDDSAQQIVDMLLDECRLANVEIKLNTEIESVSKNDDNNGRSDGVFSIKTSRGDFTSQNLVVATGGLSIPKMGATSFGHKLAKQFGLSLTETIPALVPFTFSTKDLELYQGLSGISFEAKVTCGRTSFTENILITHRGVSGPAILQISSYWKAGQEIKIHILPSLNWTEFLQTKRSEFPKLELKTILSEVIAKRFIANLMDNNQLKNSAMEKLSDKNLQKISEFFTNFVIKPNGTEGYRKAEVTLGGVNTDELNSKDMQSRKVAGLYFIGEVVDVTGWLGGYNFQWAWSSGAAAGRAV